MKYIYTLILLLLATSSVMADNKIFIEALVGKADQDLQLDDADADDEDLGGDDGSIGFKIGYQFKDNWRLELSHYDFGEAGDSFIDSFGDTITIKNNSTATNIGINYIFPSSGKFSFGLQGGLSLWDYSLDLTDSSAPGVVVSFEDDDNNIFLGLDIEYRFNEQFYAIFEMTSVRMDLSDQLSAFENHTRNFAFGVGARF